MRRVWTIVLVLGLIAGMAVAPAEAGKKKKKKGKKAPVVRTFEVRYENPAIGVGGAAGGCSGCPTVAIGPDEKFVAIFIEDDMSPSGYVDFSYDQDGDGFQDLGTGPTVCGSTPEPVEVEPGAAYTGWPWAAGIGCPGSSSISGTIKVMASSDAAALEKAMKAEG